MRNLDLLPGQPRPLVFAHRGASGEAPENTMAAFSLALAQGCPGIELDIHRCLSGEIVVFHDARTNRTAPGTDHEITHSTWSQIKTLDVGSWKGPQFIGERPILLRELLEAFGRKFYYDIEIKDQGIKDFGLEAALVDVLRDVSFGQEQVLVSSFNPFALRRFKNRAPKIPTAIIYSMHGEVPWFLRRGFGGVLAGVDVLKPEYSQVTKAISPRGKPVIPWTVDKADLARDLLARGVEGLISNHPPVILGMNPPWV